MEVAGAGRATASDSSRINYLQADAGPSARQPTPKVSLNKDFIHN